jgi:hypothetical protein
MYIVKNLKLNFIVLLLWVSMLIYFFNLDTEAFVLFLFLPPMIGVLLYFAIREGYFVLSLFFLLAFIGTAITPAYFFIHKDWYKYSGGNAIRDFNFDIYEFLYIYGYLYFMLGLILLFTTILIRIFIKRSEKGINVFTLKKYEIGLNGTSFQSANAISRYSSKRYSMYLVLFIIGVLIPLNLYMYINGIGISTVEPVYKEFKIVGISFYFRNYVAPIIITYLFFNTKRGLGLTAIILLYAIFIGLVSLSKGNVLLTCVPVILFALVDNKMTRFILSALFFLSLYGIIGWARQFVFLAEVGSFEMIRLIFDNIDIESLGEAVNLFELVGEFSNRLYGASVIVLAHKFSLVDNFSVATGFFMAQPHELSLIVTYDVFGMVPVEGVSVGIGMGYLATMILLANKNLFFLGMLSLMTGVYLTIAQIIVTKYISQVNMFASIGYALGFFMVFFLVNADIYKFYVIVVISILGLFVVGDRKKSN